jgi:hypothetical protein
MEPATPLTRFTQHKIPSPLFLFWGSYGAKAVLSGTLSDFPLRPQQLLPCHLCSSSNLIQNWMYAVHTCEMYHIFIYFRTKPYSRTQIPITITYCVISESTMQLVYTQSEELNAFVIKLDQFVTYVWFMKYHPEISVCFGVWAWISHWPWCLCRCTVHTCTYICVKQVELLYCNTLQYLSFVCYIQFPFWWHDIWILNEYYFYNESHLFCCIFSIHITSIEYLFQ